MNSNVMNRGNAHDEEDPELAAAIAASLEMMSIDGKKEESKNEESKNEQDYLLQINNGKIKPKSS